jgi:cytochrome b
MSTHSSSAAADAVTPSRQVLVWDLPVRVFHWLTVICFAGAWLTSESERWQRVHVTLGYSLAALIGFRVLWGLIGSAHARFASFVRGPAAVMAYLKSLATPRPEHHLGHNPAGGLAILALLGLGALVTVSGYLNYADLGGDWLEELHEAAASLMMALVGLHVAAVILSSRLHHENLLRAMITGRKPAQPGEPAPAVRPALWLGLLLAGLVLGFWWMRFRNGLV